MSTFNDPRAFPVLVQQAENVALARHYKEQAQQAAEASATSAGNASNFTPFDGWDSGTRQLSLATGMTVGQQATIEGAGDGDTILDPVSGATVLENGKYQYVDPTGWTRVDNLDSQDAEIAVALAEAAASDAQSVADATVSLYSSAGDPLYVDAEMLGARGELANGSGDTGSAIVTGPFAASDQIFKTLRFTATGESRDMKLQVWRIDGANLVPNGSVLTIPYDAAWTAQTEIEVDLTALGALSSTEDYFLMVWGPFRYTTNQRHRQFPYRTVSLTGGEPPASFAWDGATWSGGTGQTGQTVFEFQLETVRTRPEQPQYVDKAIDAISRGMFSGRTFLAGKKSARPWQASSNGYFSNTTLVIERPFIDKWVVLNRVHAHFDKYPTTLPVWSYTVDEATTDVGGRDVHLPLRRSDKHFALPIAAANTEGWSRFDGDFPPIVLAPYETLAVETYNELRLANVSPDSVLPATIIGPGAPVEPLETTAETRDVRIAFEFSLIEEDFDARVRKITQDAMMGGSVYPHSAPQVPGATAPNSLFQAGVKLGCLPMDPTHSSAGGGGWYNIKEWAGKPGMIAAGQDHPGTGSEVGEIVARRRGDPLDLYSYKLLAEADEAGWMDDFPPERARTTPFHQGGDDVDPSNNREYDWPQTYVLDDEDAAVAGGRYMKTVQFNTSGTGWTPTYSNQGKAVFISDDGVNWRSDNVQVYDAGEYGWPELHVGYDQGGYNRDPWGRTLFDGPKFINPSTDEPWRMVFFTLGSGGGGGAMFYVWGWDTPGLPSEVGYPTLLFAMNKIGGQAEIEKSGEPDDPFMLSIGTSMVWRSARRLPNGNVAVLGTARRFGFGAALPEAIVVEYVFNQDMQVVNKPIVVFNLGDATEPDSAGIVSTDLIAGGASGDQAMLCEALNGKRRQFGIAQVFEGHPNDCLHEPFDYEEPEVLTTDVTHDFTSLASLPGDLTLTATGSVAPTIEYQYAAPGLHEDGLSILLSSNDGLVIIEGPAVTPNTLDYLHLAVEGLYCTGDNNARLLYGWKLDGSALPGAADDAFWMETDTTPGEDGQLIMRARVDATEPVSQSQLAISYLGYGFQGVRGQRDRSPHDLALSWYTAGPEIEAFGDNYTRLDLASRRSVGDLAAVPDPAVSMRPFIAFQSVSATPTRFILPRFIIKAG